MSQTPKGERRASLIASNGAVLTRPRLKAAVLVSATLFLPKGGGVRDASYMKNQLLIPTERFDPLPTICPEWVHAPVTLHYPGNETTIDSLLYPSRSHYKATKKGIRELETDMVRWWENVAGRICDAAGQAKGGTLVLCSSYEDLNAFASRLMPLVGRLVVQQRNGRFSADRERYLVMAKAGQRPVWLALGTAWTGLDLSDPSKFGEKAKDDDFLTDVVVTRIPFSPLMHVRGKNLRLGGGYQQTISFTEAAFMFRQGIGRLVRKPGMQGKHLWVLDSRIWARNGKHYGVFQRILDTYASRQEF